MAFALVLFKEKDILQEKDNNKKFIKKMVWLLIFYDKGLFKSKIMHFNEGLCFYLLNIQYLELLILRGSRVTPLV